MTMCSSVRWTRWRSTPLPARSWLTRLYRRRISCFHSPAERGEGRRLVSSMTLPFAVVRGDPLGRGVGLHVLGEGLDRRGTHGLVLLTVAAGDPDGADDLPVVLQREAADEDRELARDHVADAEGLVAGQGRPVRPLVELVRRALVACGGVGLGDGDLDTGEACPRDAVEGDDVGALVDDAERLLHADLLGLRAGGRQDGQGVVEGDPVDA